MFQSQNVSRNFFPYKYKCTYVSGTLLKELGQLMELQESVAQPNKAHLSNIFLWKYLLRMT